MTFRRMLLPSSYCGRGCNLKMASCSLVDMCVCTHSCYNKWCRSCKSVYADLKRCTNEYQTVIKQAIQTVICKHAHKPCTQTWSSPRNLHVTVKGQVNKELRTVVSSPLIANLQPMWQILKENIPLPCTCNIRKNIWESWPCCDIKAEQAEFLPCFGMNQLVSNISVMLWWGIMPVA